MSYASRVHKLNRTLAHVGRTFIIIWIGIVAIFTCAAAADAAFHLGWGYSWNDALLGLAMVVFGFMFWLFWGFMLALIGGLNEIFFGPDPSNENQPRD